MNINFSKLVEKDEENERLKLLKDGASYVRWGAKISEIFSDGNIPAQIPSFYKKDDKSKEAEQAIKWWLSLSKAEQLKYDR